MKKKIICQTGIYTKNLIHKSHTQTQNYKLTYNICIQTNLSSFKIFWPINDLKEYISDYGSEIQKIDIALNEARIKEKEMFLFLFESLFGCQKSVNKKGQKDMSSF